MSSRTRRTLTLCVGILSVVAGATVAGANSANAGESSGKPHASVTGTNDCVAPFTLSAVDALRVDGTTQRASTNDGLGRVYQYLGAKGVVAQVLPPPGWHPLSASDKELAAYGFPRRPSDPAGRQRWNDQMTKWKRAGNPGMCETGKVNGGLTRTITSGNWAGGMNVNGSATNSTFYDSTGEWVQPGFVNVCPGASAYSTWAGLGGVNSSRLIQAGTDEWTNNFSNSYMWWEALDPAHPNPEVAFTGDAVNPGDHVLAEVHYQSPEASFFVMDADTGVSNYVAMTSYAGDPMSAYYDGTTSDFITEAPSLGGGLLYLRKPANGATYYFYASTNYAPIAQFYSWRINEVGATGHTMQNSGFDGVHAWNATWGACS